jgi:hypothetical protein
MRKSQIPFSVRVKIRGLQIINSLLQKIGYSLSRTISKEEFLYIVKALTPVNNGYSLIRVGGENDGSYLLPDDLSGISKVVSPGVGLSREFEDDLFRRVGAKAILLDPYIPDTPLLNDGDIFIQKPIGSISNPVAISLPKLIDEHLLAEELDLVLQMDIEGAEYATLLSCDLETLKLFRIIVIEYHAVTNWNDLRHFENVVLPILSNLMETHDVVHLHPNTHNGTTKLFGAVFPNFVEVTYHRKDRSKSHFGYQENPHKLDTKTSEGDKWTWSFTDFRKKIN